MHDGTVFEKLAVGLEPAELLRLRGPALKIKRISRNRHDPAGRDTLLTIGSGADQLEMFKNQYNSFLISAAITSRKIEFGRGIHIGVSQAKFCQIFSLNARYDVYQVTDAPEEAVQLRFVFNQGVLRKVSYRMLRPWTDID